MLGRVFLGHTEKQLSYHLTPEVAGDVGDMNPAAIALPDELREAYLSLLLHLLNEFEQTAVVGLVACYQVGSTAEHVVAVLHTPDERVELLAARPAAYHDRLAPRLGDGV